MCLAGTVVISWSFTQEVEDSNNPLTKFLLLYSMNSVEIFRENWSVPLYGAMIKMFTGLSIKYLLTKVN